MDMIYDLINYALPNYLEQYFPYNFILAYTVFNFILFYQQKWTAEFEGSSEFFHGLLGLFTMASMILEYAFIVVFIISIDVFSLQVWATGVAVIVVAWVLSIFLIIIEAVLPLPGKVAIISILGFVINPLIYWYLLGVIGFFSWF